MKPTTPAQRLGHQILFLLKQLKELGVEEEMLSSAFKSWPNKPGDQMLFILGMLVSQGKVPGKAE